MRLSTEMAKKQKEIKGYLALGSHPHDEDAGLIYSKAIPAVFFTAGMIYSLSCSTTAPLRPLW